MTGPIEELLTADHKRLDALLEKAQGSDGAVDARVYAEFRRGLLRHIAMEEKVLLPYARQKRGGERLPIATTLRKDHGELAALLVPSPTRALCAKLRAVLARHNPLEEGAGGLYAACDGLAGDEAASVVSRLRAQPEVPTAPYYDGSLLSKHRAPGR
ncbi:MAG: hemerythrin domain-containing protein [Polyangiaceae bacterium]